MDLTLRFGSDGERVAGVSGAVYCDSPWLCAVCAPRRAGERRDRVNRVVKATVAKGGLVALVTITVRHGRQHGLRDVKAALSSASRRSRQGKAWIKDQTRAGIVGVLVGPEVVVSEVSGWHYHQHLLVPCLSRSRADIRYACARMVRRYLAALPDGWDAVWEAQDVTVTDCEQKAARYVSKGTDVTWEVASAGATKDRMAAGSMSPFDLLSIAADREDPRSGWALAMWRSYAAEMPGTRSCVVTRSMADKLGLTPDDDQDAPGERDDEDADETHTAGTLSARVWNVLVNRRKANRLLVLLEDLGFAGWEAVERQAEVWAAPRPEPPSYGAWKRPS